MIRHKKIIMKAAILALCVQLLFMMPPHAVFATEGEPGTDEITASDEASEKADSVQDLGETADENEDSEEEGPSVNPETNEEDADPVTENDKDVVLETEKRDPAETDKEETEASIKSIKSKAPGSSGGLDVYMTYFDSVTGSGSPYTSDTDCIKTYETASQLSGSITLQINYLAEELDRDYAAGEFTFNVYGLEKFGLSNPNVAKNIFDSEHHEGTYNAETGTVEGDYWTFRNKSALNEGDSVEGMVQLTYLIGTSLTRCPLNGAKGTAYVEYEGSELSETYFEFNLVKGNTKASIVPYDVKTVSRFDNYDDYFWARYAVSQSADTSSGAVFASTGENTYEYLEYPENVELYYSQDFADSSNKVLGEPFYKLIPYETSGGTSKYRIETSQHMNTLNYIIAGYPKTEYSAGDKVSLALDFYGKYNRKSEYSELYSEMEYSYLTSAASREYTLIEYTPPEPGSLYSWVYNRRNSNNTLTSSMISDPEKMGRIGDCSFIYLYNTEPVDVIYGWDMCGISTTDGGYRKIDDDDSLIQGNSLYFPSCIKDLNGSVYEPGTIEIELYIREKGSDEYTLEKTITNGTKYSVYSNDGKEIAAYYWKIKNAPAGGIQLRSQNDTCTLKKVYAEQGTYDNTGNVLSSTYLMIYDMNGQLLTETDGPSDYPTELQMSGTPEMDMEKYGMYMNRKVLAEPIKPDTYYGAGGINYISKESGNGYITWLVTLSFGTYSNNGVRTIYGYDAYMDLPAICNTDPSEIKAATLENMSYLIAKNGTASYELSAITDKNKREDWIREYIDNAEITMEEDTDGSGNKSLHFHLDYPEGLDISSLTGRIWTFIMPVTVYDTDILDQGGAVSTLIMHKPVVDSGAVIGDKGEAALMSENIRNEHLFNIRNETWSGFTDVDTADCNGDGDKTEKFLKAEGRGNLAPAFDAQLEMTKLLKTDLNYFKIGASNVTEGGDYTYRLRARTAALGMKDLVIYDDLEEYVPDEKESWKGTFKGIDLTRSEDKGYVPDVYYSSNALPGKLGEDPSWHQYDENIDCALVKALAFDYGEQVIAPGDMISVDIMMEAPDETKECFAYNRYTAEWKRVDTSTDYVFPEISILESNATILAVGNPISDTLDIDIVKVWEDEPDGWTGRPDSITVKVLKDGEEYDTVTLSEKRGWKATVYGLPGFTEEGHQFEYTLEEEEVAGYRAETSKEGSSFTITNRISSFILTVTNEVRGDMADKNKKFNFILYTGESSDELNVQEEFSLSDGETFEAELAAGTYYRIEEEETDYKTTYENEEGMISEDTSSKIINIKNMPIKTGMVFAGCSGMMLGLGALVLLIRKFVWVK